MRSISLFFKGLVVFAALAAVAGCDDSVDFANAVPGSIVITKDLCFLSGGDEVQLSATAVDADEDEISFVWSATGGSLLPASGEGHSITWTAPAGAGTYRLTVSVSDGIDTGRGTIDIEVGEELLLIPGSNEYFDNGSYYIYSQASLIRVLHLSSLIIHEGVTIVFGSEYGGISVEGGALEVLGREGDPVTFRTNYCPGEAEMTWDGIAFRGLGPASTMKHCNIVNAQTGIKVMESASVTLDTCNISDCEVFGVEIYSLSNVEITGCKIWDNENGIRAYDSDVVIRGSSIRYNYQAGVHAGGGSGDDLDIESCYISNNVEGFRLSGSARPRVKNCSIFLNGYGAINYGIFLSSYVGGGILDFTENYWGVTNGASIAALFNTAGGNATIDYDPWLNESPVGN